MTRLSRRRFLRSASFASGAVAFVGSGGAIARSLMLPAPLQSLAMSAPVLSFHLDQPYIDPTGAALVYRPPAGARGGAPVAELSDAELSRYYGLI